MVLGEHRHGKSRVRIARAWRRTVHGDGDGDGDGDGYLTQIFVEWGVSVFLTSHCDSSFTLADNSAIVATDSIKNTVYAKAKECAKAISMEEFGILLGQHFVNTYSVVTKAQVSIIEKPWEPVVIDGKVHSHGYKLGKGFHTCEVIVENNGSVTMSSGIEELSILKTTQSGFEGFIRDKFTLLPEVRERILATEVKAVWRYRNKPFCYNRAYEDVRATLITTFFGPHDTGVYSPSVQSTLYLMGEDVLRRVPEIESIKLSMPNIHFLPVNMPTVGVKFEHDVYLPTDEPHGTIEAIIRRKSFEGFSKL